MSKEKLSQLEESGQYVFHGSPNGEIEVLEPRQGTHIPDLSKPTEVILDGRPAVSATPYADLATFRAIINGANIPIDHTSGFGVTDGKKHFRVSSEDVLTHAKDKKGYVYVFDKDKFEPYDRNGEPKLDNMEWRSYQSVKPKEVIEVTQEDLPDLEDIKIGS